MDADLERIARGLGVSAETAEAATTVLSRPDVGEAATTIGPAARDEHDLHAGPLLRVRRAAAQAHDLAVAPRARCCRGALVGGWFAYQALQDQLTRPKPVAVPTSRASGAARRHEHPRRRAQGARAARAERGRRRSARLRAGPAAGRPDREGQLRHDLVSTGPPKTTVPDVVGQSRDQAVRTLVSAGLKANVVA